jgi:hypothetical protein
VPPLRRHEIRNKPVLAAALPVKWVETFSEAGHCTMMLQEPAADAFCRAARQSASCEITSLELDVNPNGVERNPYLKRLAER